MRKNETEIMQSQIKKRKGKAALYAWLESFYRANGKDSLIEFVISLGNKNHSFKKTDFKSSDIGDTIGYFLSKDIDINRTDKSGKTAFDIAVHEGSSKILNTLLKTCNDTITSYSKYTKVSVMPPCADLYLKACKVLLQNGANLSKMSFDGKSVLEISYKKLCEITLVLTKCCNLIKYLENYYNKYGEASIIQFTMQFSSKNNTFKKAGFEDSHIDDAINFFLSKGVDINEVDDDENTALIYAVKNGLTKIVRKLVAVQGIDLNYYGVWSDCSVNCAINQKNIEIVNILVEAGADINTTNTIYDLPIVKAAFQGYFKICNILLQNGADLSNEYSRKGKILEILEDHEQSKERDEVIALVKSLEFFEYDFENSDSKKNKTSKHTKIRDTWLEEFYEINGRDSLINFVDNYSVEEIKAKKCFFNNADIRYAIHFFLSKGIDVNGIDENGNTALTAVARHGKMQVLKELVSVKGIDLNYQSDEHECALDHTIYGNNPDAVRVLVDAGANVHTYYTPFITIIRGSALCDLYPLPPKIAEYLVKSKSFSPNITNTKGDTLLMSAIRCGDATVLKVLLQNCGYYNAITLEKMLCNCAMQSKKLEEVIALVKTTRNATYNSKNLKFAKAAEPQLDIAQTQTVITKKEDNRDSTDISKTCLKSAVETIKTSIDNMERNTEKVSLISF